MLPTLRADPCRAGGRGDRAGAVGGEGNVVSLFQATAALLGLITLGTRGSSINMHHVAVNLCHFPVTPSEVMVVKGRAPGWLKGSPVPFCSLPCALPVGMDTQEVGMRESSCHHQHPQPYHCTSGLSISPAGVPQATSTGLKETGANREASCIHATRPEGMPARRPRTWGR